MMDVKIFNNDEANDFFQKQLPLQSNKVIKFESSSSQNNISDFKLKNEVRSFLSQHLNYTLIIGPIKQTDEFNYADVYLDAYHSNENIVMIGKLQFFEINNHSIHITITDVLSRYEMNYRVHFTKYQKYLEHRDKELNKIFDNFDN